MIQTLKSSKQLPYKFQQGADQDSLHKTTLSVVCKGEVFSFKLLKPSGNHTLNLILCLVTLYFVFVESFTFLIVNKDYFRKQD